MTTTGKSRGRSYPRFVGAEIALASLTFVLAFFAAQYLYNQVPGLFAAIAVLVPAPFYPTGFTVAYTITAGLIFLGINTLLWFARLRKY